jgi:DNA mismatch repair ATPase MutL
MMSSSSSSSSSAASTTLIQPEEPSVHPYPVDPLTAGNDDGGGGGGDGTSSSWSGDPTSTKTDSTTTTTTILLMIPMGHDARKDIDLYRHHLDPSSSVSSQHQLPSPLSTATATTTTTFPTTTTTTRHDDDDDDEQHTNNKNDDDNYNYNNNNNNDTPHAEDEDDHFHNSNNANNTMTNIHHHPPPTHKNGPPPPSATPAANNNNNNNKNNNNNILQMIPSSSIQRIVAGQAIYDLASCVKELLENAMDAGSTQINSTYNTYICIYISYTYIYIYILWCSVALSRCGVGSFGGTHTSYHPSIHPSIHIGGEFRVSSFSHSLFLSPSYSHRRIVRLYNQGLDIVEVSDDGCGIPMASRPYIAVPHATSKITQFQDIYGGGGGTGTMTTTNTTTTNTTTSPTLGFRGEALYCIANLSKQLMVATRTVQDRVAQKMAFRSEDGTMIPDTTTPFIPRKVGTTVAVLGFLQAVPVRYHDLQRRIQYYRNKMLQMVWSYVLFHRTVRIHVMDVHATTGREHRIFTTPQHGGTHPQRSLRDTVCSLMGSKVVSSLTNITIDVSNVVRMVTESSLSTVDTPARNHNDDDDHHHHHTNDNNNSSNMWKIVGLISSMAPVMMNTSGTTSTHSNNNMLASSSSSTQPPHTSHYFAINQRPVDVPKVSRLINELYRTYCSNNDNNKVNNSSSSRTTCVCILDFILPPHMYDINLSPDKRQVLFLQENDIYETIRQAVCALWTEQQQPTTTTTTSAVASARVPSLALSSQRSSRNKNGNVTAPLLDRVITHDHLSNVEGDEGEIIGNVSNHSSGSSGSHNSTTTNRSFRRRYAFVHDPQQSIAKQQSDERLKHGNDDSPNDTNNNVDDRDATKDNCNNQTTTTTRQKRKRHNNSSFCDNNDVSEAESGDSNRKINSTIGDSSNVRLRLDIDCMNENKSSVTDIESTNNQVDAATTTIRHPYSSSITPSPGFLPNKNDHFGATLWNDNLSSCIMTDDSQLEKSTANGSDDDVTVAADASSSTQLSSSSSQNVTAIEHRQWLDMQSKFNRRSSNSPNSVETSLAQSTNTRESAMDGKMLRQSSLLDRYAFRGVSVLLPAAVDRNSNSTDNMLDPMNEHNCPVPTNPTTATNNFKSSTMVRHHHHDDDDDDHTQNGMSKNRKMEIPTSRSHRTLQQQQQQQQQPPDSSTATATTTNTKLSSEPNDTSHSVVDVPNNPTSTRRKDTVVLWQSMIHGTDDVRIASMRDRICSMREYRKRRHDRTDQNTTEILDLEDVTFTTDTATPTTGETTTRSTRHGDGGGTSTTTSTSGGGKNLTKDDLLQMSVIGQFNLGFILASTPDGHIWILDQHASDEIYNFEKLYQETTLYEQTLIAPMALELSFAEEMCILDHMDIFEKNGFKFRYDPTQPPRHRLSLTALPHSGARDGRNAVQYGKEDVQALCAILDSGNSMDYDSNNSDGNWTHGVVSGGTGTDGSGKHGNNAVRRYAARGMVMTTAATTKNHINDDSSSPSTMTASTQLGETADKIMARLPKTIAMLASRACRGSIMIGKALSRKEMEKIIQHLVMVEHPWHCPHGRPTMCHLDSVRPLLRSDERRHSEHVAGPTITVLSQELEE